jgi:predicted component of type VI protein secretion system
LLIDPSVRYLPVAMACLRVTFDNREIDRRDLDGPLVIGRSPECDLGVRDILLSRRHCRIEPADGKSSAWVVVDLASKNGTTLNGKPLKAAVTLCNGDELRLGRVRMRFVAGKLADAGLTPLHLQTPRPADPNESMSGSGTFVGIGLLDEAEATASMEDSAMGMAVPRPQPKIPEAFAREDVYSLLATIASSSWDSIYAQARQPARTQSSDPEPPKIPRMRPRSPIDVSLQALSEPKPLATSRRLRIRRPRAASAALWMTLLCLLLIRCWPAAVNIGQGPQTVSAGEPAVVQTPPAHVDSDPLTLEVQAIIAPIPSIL